MEKKLFYFGCLGQKGHYFYGSKGPYADSIIGEFPGLNRNVMNAIDGTFTPGFTKEQGIYQATDIGPVKIVSWWDYSVDIRPGSNSNLIGSGYANAEEMIDAAYSKYPDVMNRQSRPIPKPL